MITFGQIVGLIGILIVALDAAYASLSPNAGTAIPLVMLFVGLICVVFCAAQNAEIPKD